MRRRFLTRDQQGAWKQRIISWIFPYFSERELITLVFLGFIAGIEYRKAFFDLIGFMLVDLTDFQKPWDDIKLLFAVVFIGVLFIAMIISLIHHALHERYMNTDEKELFSFIFYAALSFFSFISILEVTGRTAITFWGKIEEIYLLLFGFISFVRLISIRILAKAEKRKVYSRQMTDDQCSRKELIFILVCSLIAYVSLRTTHSLPITISLAYFYTTFLLFIIRDFSQRFLHVPQHIEDSPKA